MGQGSEELTDFSNYSDIKTGEWDLECMSRILQHGQPSSVCEGDQEMPDT